jgi:hypothetical protein
MNVRCARVRTEECVWSDGGPVLRFSPLVSAFRVMWCPLGSRSCNCQTGPTATRSYCPSVGLFGTTPSALLRVLSLLKRYSKALEYEYRVKIAALDTLKRYSIISLTLYLEWYCAYSILYSGGPH